MLIDLGGERPSDESYVGFSLCERLLNWWQERLSEVVSQRGTETA